ncbi:ABC transporter substrate-binding protein [Polaromonas eurypsychrophila]|uniref:ABC transporter substrate-binding protein n=1 Tax=Polaromonas eurypsychrophila TaxID=1614635 RepID=A0A916WGQ2_9BURK|nr:ABC transporter substrate-binding protein [Polaromonas eurypsychrophila]GGA97798.1 ABC transporter substrate-binding protein [Polaromonas eurypsychrophila]
MHRRNFILNSAQAGAALMLPTLSPLAFGQGGPIKIGFMTPLTGVAAAPGRELLDGWNMFWQQNGLKIGDRVVEILVEDDGSNPDTALQKARRLHQQQGVHMLVGNVLANTGLAVAEYAKTANVPYLMPAVAADDLTQRGRIPNVLRTGGFSASQITRPLADWARKRGYKRVVTLGQDYAFGHEQVGGFVQVFTEGGGAVAGQFWHPLNTPDLSTYLGQIKALNPDVVFSVQTGADSARILQQWSSYGFKDKIPLITSQNVTDQSVIRTLTAAECEGIISSSHFAEGRDSADTKAFVDNYEKAYKKLPGIFAAEGFTGAMWLAHALNKIKGRSEDSATLIASLSSEAINGTPFGKTVKMDAYGNPVFDVYIRRVVKRADGKLVNAVVDTYPQVSQFWTYNPTEYLKQPSYSRNFQGIAK